MNNLAFRQWINRSKVPRILVSGNDQLVQQRVMERILHRLFQSNSTVIVYDNTSIGIDLQGTGFSIQDGLCGRFFHYDPFQAVDGDLKALSRLRQIVSVLNLSSGDKLPIYFQLLQKMESLRTGIQTPLTLEAFQSYQAAFLFEERLDALSLSERERKLFRSIYYEVCQAAAEFGHAMLLLAPMTIGTEPLPSQNHSLLLYRMDSFRGDPYLQRLVGLLLRFVLEDFTAPAAVVVLDDGCEAAFPMAEMISCLPRSMELYYVTEDVFAAEESALRCLKGAFSAEIFSRHTSMESCQAIEKRFGTIPVRHSTYTVHYDRRWKANSPWDVFLGNNKSEDYGAAAPIEEPRYRKEDIMSFPAGTVLLKCGGDSMITAV